MTLEQVRKYMTGVLKQWFKNKSTLDKFDDSSGILKYNETEMFSIDPVTNNWLICGIDTQVCAKGADGKSIQSITKDDNNNIIVTFSDRTTLNIGQLDVDISADFLTENGFGNLRYYNGNFQYYSVDTDTWIDTFISPENTYIVNVIPQGMKFFRGIYDNKLGHYKLKFEEPSDTFIEGQVACIVDKVIIRRKLNSIPENENDGEMVLNVDRRDFGSYKNTWYIDETFSPNYGETWYYKAFPVSTLGFSNNLESNQVGLICRDYYLYGFTLDTNESDPASMITYIENNESFTPAFMDYATNTFDYGDWNDAWFMDIKPVMLNYDGTVAYELNPADYTKKVDGTSSDVTNVNFAGNAMVGIPKVYWKIIDNEDGTISVYFSDGQLDDEFHCWSHIDNNGDEIDYCYMPIYNGYNDGTRLRSLSGKVPIHAQTATTEINLAKANNLDDDIIWYTEIYSDRMLINLLLLLIGKSNTRLTMLQTVPYLPLRSRLDIPLHTAPAR